MTQEQFRELFVRALNNAADIADPKLATQAPRVFLIALHAPGHRGELIDIDEAVSSMYLGPNRFYRMIDVAIKEVLPTGSVAFVRVSGHPPTEFANTWDPASLGPFKQIEAMNIPDRRQVAGDGS